ncbi:unnamed protein product [Brassica rapa subsp. narinosa]
MADFQKSTQRAKWVFTPQKLGLPSYVLTFNCLHRMMRMVFVLILFPEKKLGRSLYKRCGGGV